MVKKWLNTVFLGSCFITAILIEVYCIQVWKGDIFSSLALGVVVLIFGYLFMDSIRIKLEQSSKGAKFYMDNVMNEETKKWSDKHTQMFNLQKAAYTATKKNASILNEQFGEVLIRLEVLEKNNALALQKIMELQKASLEGQKNALNLQMNNNIENTKRILSVLREEEKKNDLREQLARLMKLLEDNNGFIKEELSSEEKASGADWSIIEEQEHEALNPVDEIAEPEKPNVIPLYDDPNKALSADEIAKLFNSYGQ